MTDEQSRYTGEEISDAQEVIRQARIKHQGEDLMLALEVSLRQVAEADAIALLDGTPAEELLVP